ncbi:MAG: hypothetical protein J0L92_03395 [Deltaproteobacteria bacterium]|nr:hypothetical protein [Deltaproteobacteria bacterium]
MRADLVALTPEAVAALANLGLVKRALKEIEQGKGPSLAEADDGTVTGTFDDGVTTRLVPGKTLKDNPCSCPAPGICRHRVAVALAYRDWALAQSSAAAPQPSATDEREAVVVEQPARTVPSFERWSPGEITDDAIRTALGKRTLEDAQSTRRRGLVVEVQRASIEQPMPSARLPACTVRFLVPRELAYARCDCQVGQGCAHVALAVWAFREADALGVDRASIAIELKSPEARARRRTTDDELGPMVALVHELTETGVASAREAMAQKFALAGERLGKAGYVWPATGLEDLAWMLDRYRARSARYHAADALALATELVARARVAQRDPEGPPAELPLRYVLGQGEAMETKLDHLRLVSLGARVESEGRERSAEILLADPDTGTVMVYAKSWTFAEGESMPEGPELGRRRIAGASTLAQLAAGQVVTRVARRRASRALTIGQSSTGSTSVTPQTGDFSSLPVPIRVDSMRELASQLASLPPRMLRPRVLAESVHAVKIARVGSVGFEPGSQRLVAEVYDADGRVLFVASPFRGAAPHALDVLGRALAGGMGAVRWIAGSISHDGHGFVIDPTLVVADRVVAPDVEERGEHGALASAVSHRPPPAAAAVRLEAARAVLEEAFHLGLTAVPSSHEARVERAARELEEIGARGLSRRLRRYRDARVRRRAGDTLSVPDAFFDAAVRVALAMEAARNVSLGMLATAGVSREDDEGDHGEEGESLTP